MPRFIYDKKTDAMVEVFEAPRQPSVFPQIMRDIPDYMSPMGTGLIAGRTQRREDMKVNNVREVDPSEKPKPPVVPEYVKEWRAERGITRSNPNE